MTAILALVAGGAAPIAIRLGLAMTALQFSIGALNDLVDADRDRGRRPVKPVAEGLVSRRTAARVAGLCAVTGLCLAAASGPATLAVAAVGAGCGYAYDLWLSRTAWSWLPLAIALPLVPALAWLGATGTLIPELAALVPIAVLAGAGLAIGNGLVDLDLDRLAGVDSLAGRLGRTTAGRLHAASLGLAVVAAVATAPVAAALETAALAGFGLAIVAVGAALVLGPEQACPFFGRQMGGPLAVIGRRLGWQLEALGVALLGIGWLVAQLASRGAGA